MPNINLANIRVGETAICSVDPKGNELLYRGYDINDLCEQGSYEETAYLLIHGKLPTESELSNYHDTLLEHRALAPATKNLLEMIPAETHPMDVLCTITSFLATLTSKPKDFLETRVANELVAALPVAILYWHHFHHNKIKISTHSSIKGTAAFVLTELYQDTPDKDMVSMLDQSFTLYAEHEFNPSAFAARVTASTRASFHSAICSAIATLSGPLHGGNITRAYKLISGFAEPDQVADGINTMLSEEQNIAGIGHSVYQEKDPRTARIKKWAQTLAKKKNNRQLLNMAETIERTVSNTSFANVDLYTATAYALADIPISLFAPLFVIGRVAGWSAHIFEQRGMNTLIRPTAIYVGPSKTSYPCISERK